jgi:hypothetical protein
MAGTRPSPSSPQRRLLLDPSLAPEGKHVVTFQGGVTPYD